MTRTVCVISLEMAGTFSGYITLQGGLLELRSALVSLDVQFSAPRPEPGPGREFRTRTHPTETSRSLQLQFGPLGSVSRTLDPNGRRSEKSTLQSCNSQHVCGSTFSVIPCNTLLH
uniref:Uncharacterized protein n=1 Tax=Nothobranchius pienaari TaxID=704102 RepID=A0A1A8R4A2_9TELE